MRIFEALNFSAGATDLTLVEACWGPGDRAELVFGRGHEDDAQVADRRVELEPAEVGEVVERADRQLRLLEVAIRALQGGELFPAESADDAFSGSGGGYPKPKVSIRKGMVVLSDACIGDPFSGQAAVPAPDWPDIRKKLLLAADRATKRKR